MRNLQTSDLFAASRLITKLGMKEEIKDLCMKSDNAEDLKNNIIGQTDDGRDISEKGFEIFYNLFEKATTAGAEDELYNFFASIMEKTPEEIKTGDPCDLIEEFTNTIDTESLKRFFGQVARLMNLKSLN